MLNEETLLLLLEKSEQRIDRTNEMICKLADATSTMNSTLLLITKEYTRQLDKLQKCRDNLAKLNEDLIKENEKLLAAATAPRSIINNK